MISEKNIFPCFPGGFHAARTGADHTQSFGVLRYLHRCGVIQHSILKTFHFICSMFVHRRQKTAEYVLLVLL